LFPGVALRAFSSLLRRRRFVRLLKLADAERCPSGLRSTLGKRVLGKLNRGFESHPLRHSSEKPTKTVGRSKLLLVLFLGTRVSSADPVSGKEESAMREATVYQRVRIGEAYPWRAIPFHKNGQPKLDAEATAYRVRFRENGKQKMRTFPTHSEADAHARRMLALNLTLGFRNSKRNVSRSTGPEEEIMSAFISTIRLATPLLN
jgi:hypothetical protein